MFLKIPQNSQEKKEQSFFLNRGFSLKLYFQKKILAQVFSWEFLQNFLEFSFYTKRPRWLLLFNPDLIFEENGGNNWVNFLDVSFVF